MSTVFILVEGQTEEEFVNNSLVHHLKGFAIDNVIPILLETSPGFYGGDVSFARYQTNAINLLVSNPTAIVTSLIDYYQLRSDFPGYTASLAIADINARIDYLEQEIAKVITDVRFIPYIQLYEFEGLLFSDVRGFEYISNINAANMLEIRNTIDAYPNPELINDGHSTAPSKRLKRLIPRYKKTFHGPIIALENGMAPVLAKCQRFNNWITTIVNKNNTP